MWLYQIIVETSQFILSVMTTLSSRLNVTFITTKDAACHEYVNNQND